MSHSLIENPMLHFQALQDGRTAWEAGQVVRAFFHYAMALQFAAATKWEEIQDAVKWQKTEAITADLVADWIEAGEKWFYAGETSRAFHCYIRSITIAARSKL